MAAAQPWGWLPGVALTDELIELSQELGEPGGDSTRIGDAVVCCRIRPPELAGASSIVVIAAGAAVGAAAEDASHVLLRDPRCPPSVPLHDAVKRFRVTPGSVVGAFDEDGSQV